MHDSTDPMDIDPQLGVSQASVFDFEKTIYEQDMKPNSFDIIVSLDSFPVDVDSRIIVDTLNSLLVPGGYLLMLRPDESTWSSHYPGIEWFDFAFGPPRFTDLSSKKKLSKLLLDVGFVSPAFYSNVDVDPFFFSLEVQKAADTQANQDPAERLYDESSAFAFDYEFGAETDLQWSFSGLDPLRVDCFALAAVVCYCGTTKTTV